MLLSDLPPLEQTKAGKELIEIGFRQGFEIGYRIGFESGLKQAFLDGIIIGKIQIMQQSCDLEELSIDALRVLSSDELLAIYNSLKTWATA